ncbi:MAG: pyridoxal-phosphate dependent enzyme [Methylococcales bacterium]
MQAALSDLQNTFQTSVLTRITDPFLQEQHIELWIKRDDLLHPIISGNKWRKLKYILAHALAVGADTLISMGGSYSNHLHALAYVGKVLGLKTIGLIRGEAQQPLTATLMDMQNWGMELRFVSRSDYRVLRQYRGCFDLPGLKPGQYWLPEGGAQVLALQGVAEVITEIAMPYDVLCVPCGTGATLAGLIAQAPESVSILGFAALKNADFLNADVKNLLQRPKHNWQINLDYHFGGFAKTNSELLSFVDGFELNSAIPIEPIYTGKMLYGLYDLIRKQQFKPGRRIIAVHTGGLQGKRGILQCKEN